MNMPRPLGPPQYPQRDENRMIELQKRLMEAWEQRNVEDYYQEIILNFLDKIASNQVEYQIAKEIKATHQGHSFYFKLNNQLHSRQKAINNLEKLITQSKFQNKNQIMPRICDEIKRLRDSNLGCAQTIIQLNREFGQKSENLTAHQQLILWNLDQQNAFLNDSFLKNYIFFQNGYDPFFLHHYDLKGKKRPQSAHPDVDRLFNLNVSYACRLFKTKKQLLNIISTGRVSQRFSNEVSKRDATRRNSKMIGNSEKSTYKYDTLNSDRETEKESKKTSVNFRGKPLSLQAAIQQDLLRNNQSLKDSNASKFRTRKLHTVAPQNLEQSYPKVDRRFSSIQTPQRKHYNQHLQEGDFEQKIIPRRNLSNAPSIIIPDQSNKLYKLVPVQSMIPKKYKKKKSVADYYEPQQLIQSLNWKVKLQPIVTNQTKNIQPNQPKRSSPIAIEKKKQSLSPKEKDPDEDKNESELEDSNDKPKISINRRLKKKKSNYFDVQANNSPDASQKKKKQLKMRPGKYSFGELMKYLKGLRLKQQVKSNTIFCAKWEQSLSKSQSYFCQFVQNSQLLAVVICIKTIEGPYCIKLWGPIYNCDLQTSNLLFQKYIQYIQRHTKQQQLYFNGDYMEELKSCRFVQKRQNLFCRKRFFQGATKQPDFQPFLSLKCSNIVFKQAKTTSNILYSQQIQSFSKQTTYISPAVALIEKRELSSQLSMLVKVNEELKDLKVLNRLLQDQSFDTYQQDPKLKISNINALRCYINTAFKSSFLVNEGFIRLSGFQLIKTQKEILYKVPCVKNNTFVYFGKGFSDCSKFIQNSKRQGKKILEFDVKMFNKELYGRLPVQSNESCYGNWEISLWWQDELQGRVKHPKGSVQSLGPDPFFTGIQIEGELVYAFQVKKSDILL